MKLSPNRPKTLSPINFKKARTGKVDMYKTQAISKLKVSLHQIKSEEEPTPKNEHSDCKSSTTCLRTLSKNTKHIDELIGQSN